MYKYIKVTWGKVTIQIDLENIYLTYSSENTRKQIWEIIKIYVGIQKLSTLTWPARPLFYQGLHWVRPLLEVLCLKKKGITFSCSNLPGPDPVPVSSLVELLFFALSD